VFRIVFYSHDTFGLGHLSRCLKLAHHIAPALGSVQGLFLTGSAWTGLFDLPPGFRFVLLPPVVKQGRSYRVKGASSPLATAIRERQRRVDEALSGFRPHLLVADNVPCGLLGELLPSLRMLRRRQQTTAVLSLRDVLDRTDVVTAEWNRVGAEEALELLYDEIWFFGEESDARHLTENGPLSRHTGKVVRCGRLAGYPSPERPPKSPPAKATPRSHRGPAILVTGGGGGDAHELVTAYIEALRNRQPLVSSRIVLGPDFPIEKISPLLARNGFSARVERFVPNLGELMASADVVVAMAGYNTVCEIESSGRPAVLVPRVWPRQEQILRALKRQQDGLARVVHPDCLTPDGLWKAIEACIGSPAVPPPRQPGGPAAAARVAGLMGKEPMGEPC
jgi:predicted glycosyltransferase